MSVWGALRSPRRTELLCRGREGGASAVMPQAVVAAPCQVGDDLQVLQDGVTHVAQCTRVLPRCRVRCVDDRIKVLAGDNTVRSVCVRERRGADGYYTLAA